MNVEEIREQINYLENILEYTQLKRKQWERFLELEMFDKFGSKWRELPEIKAVVDDILTNLDKAIKRHSNDIEELKTKLNPKKEKKKKTKET